MAEIGKTYHIVFDFCVIYIKNYPKLKYRQSYFTFLKRVKMTVLADLLASPHLNSSLLLIITPRSGQLSWLLFCRSLQEWK